MLILSLAHTGIRSRALVELVMIRAQISITAGDCAGAVQIFYEILTWGRPAWTGVSQGIEAEDLSRLYLNYAHLTAFDRLCPDQVLAIDWSFILEKSETVRDETRKVLSKGSSIIADMGNSEITMKFRRIFLDQLALCFEPEAKFFCQRLLREGDNRDNSEIWALYASVEEVKFR